MRCGIGGSGFVDRHANLITRDKRCQWRRISWLLVGGTLFPCFPDCEEGDASPNRSLETVPVGWNSVWMTGRIFDDSTDAIWPTEGSTVSPKARKSWVVLERIRRVTASGDAKISNMDGDGGFNDALPLSLSWCRPLLNAWASSLYANFLYNGWSNVLYCTFIFLDALTDSLFMRDRESLYKWFVYFC